MTDERSDMFPHKPWLEDAPSSSHPEGQLETPFLEEASFAALTEEGREETFSPLGKPQIESPFQSAFEQEALTAVQGWVLPEELQVAPQKPSTEPLCAAYPDRLRVIPWTERIERIAREGKSYLQLLAKTWNHAILVRGQVRLPTKSAQWLLEAAQKDPGAGEANWFKNLTISPAELVREVPKVNVSIEIFRFLRDLGSLKDHAVSLSAYLRTRSPQDCWLALFGVYLATPDNQKFLEKNYEIKLDGLIARSGVKTAELNQHFFFTYVNFPSSIEKFIQYKIKVVDDQVKKFPEIPAHLKAERLGRAGVTVSIWNVKTILEADQQKTLPSWTRRLVVGLDKLAQHVPLVQVTIDLFHVDPTRLDPSGDPLMYFKTYVEKSGAVPSLWHYLTVLYKAQNRSSLEKPLHIDLGSLLSPHKITEKHVLLVTIALPNLAAWLVGDNRAVLDNFAFAKHQLTPAHQERLRILAGHIVDSWRFKPWQRFQPVMSLNISGHADTVGGEGFNVRLSEQRAREVEKFLKDTLDRQWQKTPDGAGSAPLTASIQIDIQGLGKSLPPPGEPANVPSPTARRVEINLDYSLSPEDRLKEIIEHSQEAFKDAKLVDSVFRSSEQAKQARCMLEKLLASDVDDVFIPNSNVSRYTIFKTMNDSMFASLRAALIAKFSIRKPMGSKKEILEKWKQLNFEVTHAIKEIERIASERQTLMPWPVLRELYEEYSRRKNNKNSIYNCFG